MEEIIMLKAQNEGLRKQNKELQQIFMDFIKMQNNKEEMEKIKKRIQNEIRIL